MYTLKSIVQRGTLFGASAALVVAVVAPAISVFAQALNPLTERSLLLTSSAPGFQDSDGAGYSEASPNPVGDGGVTIPNHYAPAGSGANGKKTGQTFTFKTSTLPSATVKGFSLQYCTSAAGYCQAPGNNTGDARTHDQTSNSGEVGYDADDPTTWGDPADWDTRTPNREINDAAHLQKRSDLDFVGDFGEGVAEGTFEVKIDGATQSGWQFAKTNLESPYHKGAHTGKNNYVTLVHETGAVIAGGTEVQIIFRPSESIYITNPGANEFFVKINTYSSDTSLIGSHNDSTPFDSSDATGHTVVDGGVTVANVMTDSIHITTKVLETMAFSVGTENRDTVNGLSYHGKCDPVNQKDNNRLQLGNPSAEYSLETGRAWDVYSYWRLSSNSSGGATVYYSGDTLANTVGDKIADMPNEVESTPGTEQFGLGFVDANFGVAANPDDAARTTDIKSTDANWDANYQYPSSFPFRTLTGQASTDATDPSTPTNLRNFGALSTQTAADNYDEAMGTIFNDSGASVAPGTAKFRFLASSSTVPERIAQQNETVISCATAKMRYVANIGADTPAGVYTTKINYLAAPQY